MNLAGKIALVTGAGRGIGRGIAEVFAEQGADVAVNDIEVTPEGASSVVEWIRSKGRRAIAVQADVSDRIAVESMFEKAVAAIKDGSNLLILTDRGVSPKNAPVPSLLACAGLHHHLVRVGMRTRAGLVIECGDAREVQRQQQVLSAAVDESACREVRQSKLCAREIATQLDKRCTQRAGLSRGDGCSFNPLAH